MLQCGTDSIECVRQPNSTFSGHINLGNIMKTIDTDDYFTYPGSLTHPGCKEAVIWMVFPNIVSINSAEVNMKTVWYYYLQQLNFQQTNSLSLLEIHFWRNTGGYYFFQLKRFRKLKTCTCTEECNTFRPVQPLGSRVVRYNKNNKLEAIEQHTKNFSTSI